MAIDKIVAEESNDPTEPMQLAVIGPVEMLTPAQEFLWEKYQIRTTIEPDKKEHVLKGLVPQEVAKEITRILYDTYNSV